MGRLGSLGQPNYLGMTSSLFLGGAALSNWLAFHLLDRRVATGDDR